MQVRYGELPLDALRALFDLGGLRRLFLDLVTRTDGDVGRSGSCVGCKAGPPAGGPRPRRASGDASKKDGLVARDAEGRLSLAPPGERQVRRAALEEVFSSLSRSGAGLHALPREGTGTEAPGGDAPTGVRRRPLPARRHPDGDERRAARPEKLAILPEDLEVHETEHQTACATAIAIDVSHSVVLYGEDRFTPTKKVALALTELILSKYPKDTIDVVLFGDDAERVPIESLIEGEGRAVPHEHARRPRALPRPPPGPPFPQPPDLPRHRRQALVHPGEREALQEPVRPRPEDREPDAGRGRALLPRKGSS